MSLEDINELPDSVPAKHPGHRTDHEKIHRGLKSLLEALQLKVAKNEIVYNVKDFGAKGDGTTNDTAAINAAIAAMPSIANSWGNGASGVLYFPAGRYSTDGGHIIPNNKRMKVCGAGPYVSILSQRAGSTSDLLTVNAANSGIDSLTLAGTRSAGGGDLVVLNAGYGYVTNATLLGANANAITVGKDGGSIVHRISNVNIREPRGYGILTVSASGSTDGQWNNIDIGLSGLSAVRLDTGTQMLNNVHVWGSGMESDTDKHGFYMSSTSSQIVACESECNRGYGFYIAPSGSNYQNIISTKIWGNGAGAINAFQVDKLVIASNSIYRNCVNNTGGSTAFAYAAIGNDGGKEWAITGNNIWDDGAAIPAGPTGYTYNYPGRTAGSAQHTSAYVEQNAADYNALSGNVMRAERTRSGKPYIFVGVNNSEQGNVYGSTLAVPTIASAATLTIPAGPGYIEVTGTTAITSIAASKIGRQITFVFTNASPAGMTDGAGTLRLEGNFAPAQYGTITLICGGAYWYEVSRSAA
ncbi:hypothetical protein PBI_PEREGRIN_69 [Rhodococcus phage Peregrin]|nr:hypothetical protein PBI_PEREGRIN_69 [Rhodococcus phage Peregrin]